MTSDLARAYEALKGKKGGYDKMFTYYDGEQPLTYTSTRLADIFKDLDAYFAENWCSVVVDSTRDRINLREVQIKNATAAKMWREMWERTELSLESDETHEAALVAGEAYVIVWKDEAGQVDAYANDPRLCHIFYDAQFPRKKKFAAKWFEDDDGKLQLTLYYPDRLEYYISSGMANGVSEASSFVAKEPASAANPFGEIPVFHFRLAQRKAKSDLKSVIAPQNGINKLLTDMMVTAEYLAYPQRYIISNAETQGKVRNAPNEILDLPAGDGMGQQTQAGQFPAADLKNYLDAIDNLATAISSITRTPKHYFFSVGSNLSGEALMAMEAPLNKKAQDRIDRFSPVWKQVVLFMLKAAGQTTVKTDEVEIVFDKPETIQPKTLAETRQMNVNAGMPLKSILRDEGKSEAYIKQVEKDIEEEATRASDLSKVYLAEAKKNFDQGVNNAAE